MRGASAGTPTKPRPARGFVVFAWTGRPGAFSTFKWSVYALLAANVWLYAQHGRVTEWLDTAAWFLLLMLFEWETAGGRIARRARTALHGLRVLASLAIAVACAGYALEAEWLDFANQATWLAVVALLELEVRVPAERTSLHRLRRLLAGACYAALFAFLLAWVGAAPTGAEPGQSLLDAWDAALWLVAFVAIELNVVRATRTAGSPSAQDCPDSKPAISSAASS